MNHIGLFEGIGGFSLAADWMGWETIAWCEINGFCQKILKQHFPKAIGHGDIKTTDFSIYRGQCDIVTGGFPCQPFSSAGKRKGTEDNRYLWPEMLRAIREISPRWIVGENVRGLTNWNGGLVFDEVQADLETEGYEVLPFLLPACAVNAPHRRDRIWFIAYAVSSRTRAGTSRCNQSWELLQEGKWKENKQFNKSISESGIITNADSSERCEGRLYPSESETAERYIRPRNARGHERRNWEDFPTQPPVCRRDDGVPNRVDRIKALGNAVVPQLVFQIFKAIEQYEQRNQPA